MTVEDYFSAQSGGKTSDHTLARLETPRMDQEQLNEALVGVQAPYKYVIICTFIREYTLEHFRFNVPLLSAPELMCLVC